MTQAQGHQAEAGVGNQGHPGVGNQGNLRSLLQRDQQFRRAGHLVVFVVAYGGLSNLVMIQKNLGVAGVLAGDLIHFAKDAEGSQGDVLQVADRCSDQV